MSSTDKIYGLLKSVMLMGERFDAIDDKMKDLSSGLSALSGSHAELAQRVAAIEGYLRGRADQASAQSATPRIGG